MKFLFGAIAMLGLLCSSLHAQCCGGDDDCYGVCGRGGCGGFCPGGCEGGCERGCPGRIVYGGCGGGSCGGCPSGNCGGCPSGRCGSGGCPSGQCPNSEAESKSFGSEYQNLYPAVVTIHSSQSGAHQMNLCSGFIADRFSGCAIIETCAHVHSAGDNEIIVVTQDGRKFAAEALKIDVIQDQMILRIQDPGIKPMHITGDIPTVGEKCTLIGFAHGKDFMVTVGKLQGYSTGLHGGDKCYMRMTNSAIEGVSGGPVLDSRGNAIGTVTARFEAGGSLAPCLPVVLPRITLGETSFQTLGPAPVGAIECGISFAAEVTPPWKPLMPYRAGVEGRLDKLEEGPPAPVYPPSQPAPYLPPAYCPPAQPAGTDPNVLNRLDQGERRMDQFGRALEGVDGKVDEMEKRNAARHKTLLGKLEDEKADVIEKHPNAGPVVQELDFAWEILRKNWLGLVALCIAAFVIYDLYKIKKTGKGVVTTELDTLAAKYPNNAILKQLDTDADSINSKIATAVGYHVAAAKAATPVVDPIATHPAVVAALANAASASNVAAQAQGAVQGVVGQVANLSTAVNAVALATPTVATAASPVNVLLPSGSTVVGPPAS